MRAATRQTSSCSMSSLLFPLLLLVRPVPVLAQFSDWVHGQVNTSICVWNQPSAAIVRDTIYIDGGSAWWTAGLENGTYGPIANQGNFNGLILSYNLSRPFDQDTNVTGILLDGSMSKARGGKLNGHAASPNYEDGAMLANYAEFFLYGGAIFQFDLLYPAPDASAALSYQAYLYGPDRPRWHPGFNERRLPDGVTRYIASGGAVSAPSENKAWYFSGLTAPGRGPISSNGAANETLPSVASDTLITLDMSSELTEKWTNSTLPEHVRARAGSEVVWVPIGSQGILVVLGGVVYPEWAETDQVSSNEEASKKLSPEFMSTVDIYDIANDKWYKQPTQGAPGTRARGCAVVAPSSDHSSFNIYYYGGFDGIHYMDSFHDDVWVLSLPSFTWTKISDGSPSHARAGHKCFLPYPDQMMVVGGYTDLSGSELHCLQDGPIVLFNLTSGEWLRRYHPQHYGEYGVHEKVQAVIGGNATGHATATKPLPSGWANAALGDVFATPYNVNKIQAYWPYSLDDGATGYIEEAPLSPSDPSASKPGQRVPRWAAPVLGVVSGLMLVTGCILVWCICRRYRRPSSRATTGSDRSVSHDCVSNEAAVSERLRNWLRGQTRHRAPPTAVSTNGEDSDVERSDVPRNTSPSLNTTSARPSEYHEMENTQIVELGDTSPPAELYGSGQATEYATHRDDGDFSPILTSFSSLTSLPSGASHSPGGWPTNGSVSDVTPSTPHHASSVRWPRRMSTISAVSSESAQRPQPRSPGTAVSPIMPASFRAGDRK